MDFGEANILSEKEDTVKIMSIHGSKGLEFPVVFVAGLGKQMNMQDARVSIVLHPDLGIGAPWVDEKLRIRTRTILQRAIQQEITLESLGEELRILYVALTRAREKLILTGTLTKLPERLSQQDRIVKIFGDLCTAFGISREDHITSHVSLSHLNMILFISVLRIVHNHTFFLFVLYSTCILPIIYHFKKDSSPFLCIYVTFNNFLFRFLSIFTT